MEKELKGKKVVLREQREEDAKFFAYWFNQPRIMFQCGFTEKTDEETEKKYINEYHQTDDCDWYTITTPDGNIIGETGLLRMFPAWHQTDLTIIIPDPEKQHRGYGTEAVSMMLDLAFYRYQMNRVSIGVVGKTISFRIDTYFSLVGTNTQQRKLVTIRKDYIIKVKCFCS
ncbi:MAG: GNAT family N-acetyltransferase, partial [Oscillospiraceae bacterium]|nr:GNAT family N-acetyltransferase [Oscillospiraceae bacterium]